MNPALGNNPHGHSARASRVAHPVSILLLLGLTSLARAQSIFDDNYKPRNPDNASSSGSSTPAPSSTPTPTATPPTETPSTTPPALISKPRPSGNEPVPTVAKLPQPIPSAAAVAENEKTVHELFASDFAKSSPDQKLLLGTRLIAAASSEDVDPAARYVLLTEAMKAYAAGGDYLSGIDCWKDLSWNFAVNADKSLATLLRPAVRAKPLTAGAARCAYLATWYGKRAVLDGNYEDGESLAKVAGDLANASRDPGAIYVAKELSDELVAIRNDLPKLNASKLRLASNPADADASLAVGSFLCFDAQDWDHGLPLLQKGSDSKLQQLAQMELGAAALSPRDKLKLSEDWADVAKRQRESSQRDQILEHANLWHQRALPDLSDLDKLAARKHAPLQRIPTQHGLIAQIFRGQTLAFLVATRIDPNIYVTWTDTGPEPATGTQYFSIRWHGWLQAPQPGTYKIVGKADDQMTVTLNGQPILHTNYSDAAEKQVVSVELGAAPEELNVDFAQSWGGAFAGLGWIPPGATKPVAIPTTAFTHEPVDLTELFQRPVTADRDGTVTLSAASAELHGSPLSFYDGEGFPELAYWGPTNFPVWNFKAAAGDYDVILTYACAPGYADCTYRLAVGSSVFTQVVAETGGWTTPRTELIGKTHLDGANQRLLVRSLASPHGTVMNLIDIKLEQTKNADPK